MGDTVKKVSCERLNYAFMGMQCHAMTFKLRDTEIVSFSRDFIRFVILVAGK